MNAIEQIADELQRTASVEVAWLYGSRATGSSSPDSDFDIAVALRSNTENSHQVIDEIQYSLTQLANVKVQVSVIDLNKVPSPLAINVIEEGRIIVCQSDLRLRSEQQRIWSLWEEYKYQHERNRERL